jgi:hypothetical protein
VSIEPTSTLSTVVHRRRFASGTAAVVFTREKPRLDDDNDEGVHALAPSSRGGGGEDDALRVAHAFLFRHGLAPAGGAEPRRGGAQHDVGAAVVGAGLAGSFATGLAGVVAESLAGVAAAAALDFACCRGLWGISDTGAAFRAQLNLRCDDSRPHRLTRGARRSSSSGSENFTRGSGHGSEHSGIGDGSEIRAAAIERFTSSTCAQGSVMNEMS